MKTSILLAAAAALLAVAATASARPASPAEGLLASIPGFTPTAIGAKPPFGFEAKQAKRTYVGRVRGSKANVAIVVRGKTAVGYLCDGSPSLTSWLTGTNRKGKIALASDDGRRVTGVLRGGAIRGAVSAGGRTLRFTAVPAVQGKTGVWREHVKLGGQTAVRGWIIAGKHFTGADRFGKTTIGFASSTGGGPAGGGGGGGVAPTGGGQGGQQGGGPPPPGVGGDTQFGPCTDLIPAGCDLPCSSIVGVITADSKMFQTLDNDGNAKNDDIAKLYLDEESAYFNQLAMNGC